LGVRRQWRLLRLTPYPFRLTPRSEHLHQIHRDTVQGAFQVEPLLEEDRSLDEDTRKNSDGQADAVSPVPGVEPPVVGVVGAENGVLFHVLIGVEGPPLPGDTLPADGSAPLEGSIVIRRDPGY